MGLCLLNDNKIPKDYFSQYKFHATLKMKRVAWNFYFVFTTIQ